MNLTLNQSYQSVDSRQVVIVTMLTADRVWFDVDKTRLGVNPHRYSFGTKSVDEFYKRYQAMDGETHD